ncbi:MAG: N-acetyl-gamma-glutamyl-phosphate reductase [Chloroflexi bacterium]|nr:MAG: N-acetyl-gamma-glutamyl-phosphate reductase [Chloroflexota bacterium]TMC42046.1 MAG: N-acetyl-gamma-glutamyl-phosphate reductase [Chloroflexota bacterium]TMC89111.1 MAG: N-acetyl-gamma-glutamyl-phosphate reductase [Chloroflexota bacterium]
MNRLRVAIIGGSGYTGGELARLLLFHPRVELTQVASGSHAGQYLHSVHPNLRKISSLRFCHPDDLKSCDLLFLCLPHGLASREIERYRSIAPRVIDLSADFRLRSAGLYEQWYGEPHCASHLLDEAVYGLPELHREELPGATLVSGTGCMATAAILGLAPLYRAGLVDDTLPLVVEAKVGSSAAGATPGPGSHHPDRSGAVRSFQPTGHRHTAELIQELGRASGGELRQHVAFSATAVELVRGVLVTAHPFLNENVDERTLWRLYREAYQHEPFIRLIKERSGVYRYPEPKILAGSNYCDIGFELDPIQQRVGADGGKRLGDTSREEGRRVVIIAALDNLLKGAAGNAVQALNCVYGWDESLGLTFPGLHPV